MADFAKARKTAEQAFMLMERYGLEPTPVSVMTWYAYAEGIHPDWNKKLDQLLADKNLLSEQEKNETICHFLLALGNCRAIFNTVNGVYSTINTAVECIAAAEEETAAFSRKLFKRTNDLKAPGTAASVDKIVAAICSDTEAMAEKYHNVAEQLRDTSDKVLLLQSKLEEARTHAITDVVSGLANRRYFDARLLELAEEAEQTGNDLCLMMIDIDFFKEFNDKHGHIVGDEVIRLVSRFLTGTLREEDIAARYGGDEIAVILPGIELLQAVARAERFRKKLSSRPLVKRGDKHELGRLTVSVGVTSRHPGEPVEDFVERADKLLYAAKARGRNLVVAET